MAEKIPVFDLETKAKNLLGDKYIVNLFMILNTDEQRLMLEDLENRLRGKSQEEQDKIKVEWLKEVDEKERSFMPRRFPKESEK